MYGQKRTGTQQAEVMMAWIRSMKGISLGSFVSNGGSTNPIPTPGGYYPSP
jgi:hypothetical protein